jgi:hypothetical protein
MDGVGESACVRFFITNSMQFSPLTVHLSVQRATTKSVSTRKIKCDNKCGAICLIAPLRPQGGAITAFSERVCSASTQQRLERLEPTPLCVV